MSKMQDKGRYMNGFLTEMFPFVYYTTRKKHGIMYSLREMFLSPILHILEIISSDYPDGKRWYINY